MVLSGEKRMFLKNKVLGQKWSIWVQTGLLWQQRCYSDTIGADLVHSGELWFVWVESGLFGYV